MPDVNRDTGIRVRVRAINNVGLPQNKTVSAADGIVTISLPPASWSAVSPGSQPLAGASANH